MFLLGVLYEQTLTQSAELKQYYKAQNVYEIWECDWKQQYELTQYDEDLSNIILDREELFYGGRTEVFSPYANDNTINKLSIMMYVLYILQFVHMICYQLVFLYVILV